MKTLSLLALTLALSTQAQAATHCDAIDPTTHQKTFGLDISWGNSKDNGFWNTKQDALVKFSGALEDQSFAVVFEKSHHSTRCGTYSDSYAEIPGIAKISLLDRAGGCGHLVEVDSLTLLTSPESSYDLQCTVSQ